MSVMSVQSCGFIICIILLKCYICFATKRKYPFSRAQAEEDIFLYENYFFGKKQGVIVESGALDGMTYSTSYFFERTLEWRSVHIEASPINYKKLVMYRKLSINIHAALCTNSTTLHFLDGRTGGKGGRATSGIAEFMNIKFVERFHPEYFQVLKYTGKLDKEGVQKLKDEGVRVSEISCLRLSDILLGKTALLKDRIRHVDIWVLDVEGAESSVLKGMSLSKDLEHESENAVSVSVILVESPGGPNSAIDYLTVHQNYTCIPFRHNFACHHKSFTPVSSKNAMGSL